MEHILEMVGRAALAFAIMMVITRLLGKQTIAQMTYHDFVAAITLGALTANLAFNVQMKMWHMITTLLTFTGIAYLLMDLSLRNRTLRKWFSGQPTMIIQNGKILEGNMRKLKFSLDTLNQELRERNIYNIEEVQFAVLELNGEISILRKPEYLPVTRKDLKLKSDRQWFPVELIMDGKIIQDNLQQNNLTIEWLMSQVQKKGLTVAEVNYAVKSSNGHVYFDKYDDQMSNPIDKE
ncbi:hypothetical protein AN963_01230 [Brevibacillus choshinensis]|uniref:DUF421 domain-containing protein n=1 Tax=Brevibacillus choshinensis TaxID=54911 RepID=A0ABR5NA88_BRECH|nr:DUF421 domain-containing protein [Brevibacillus choshinensis]KQL48463.1 hypothetical protein AN963_01230 [Brevibacillus choshinensis]